VIYLDASVLVSLLILDAHTDKARALFMETSETAIVSDLASLEVSAVLSRDLRAGRLNRESLEAALLDFEDLRARCRRLGHFADDFELAERMVRDVFTKLAAADALHLASAKNANATLATFDLRLAEAARSSGVATHALP